MKANVTLMDHFLTLAGTWIENDSRIGDPDPDPDPNRQNRLIRTQREKKAESVPEPAIKENRIRLSLIFESHSALQISLAAKNELLVGPWSVSAYAPQTRAKDSNKVDKK